MNTFNLSIGLTTVNKRGGFKEVNASCQIHGDEEQINHDDKELHLFLASHFQPQLKHPIVLVRILESKKVK